MKIIFLILISLVTYAETEFFPLRSEMIYGRGTSAGFCRGDAGAFFCVQDLENRAEADAKRNMEFDCRIKNGQLDFYISCSGFCNPSMIQPDRNEYVNCSTNCQGRCEINN